MKEEKNCSVRSADVANLYVLRDIFYFNFFFPPLPTSFRLITMCAQTRVKTSVDMAVAAAADGLFSCQ